MFGINFKSIALICGFGESLFFCAIIYGLNSLFETMKKESLFLSYCNISLNFSINSNETITCGIQDKYFGYLLIIAGTSQCIFALPLGYLYDKIGQKFSKIFVAFIFLLACLFFAGSFGYANFLAYIASFLYGIVIQMLLYCNLALGNLFPKHKNLIVSLISATVDASSLVFTFFGYIHYYGVKLFASFLFLGIFGFVVMVLSAAFNLGKVDMFMKNLNKANNNLLAEVDQNLSLHQDNAGDMFMENLNKTNNNLFTEVDQNHSLHQDNAGDMFMKNLNKANNNLLAEVDQNHLLPQDNAGDATDMGFVKRLELYKTKTYPNLKSVLFSRFYICHFLYFLVVYFRFSFFLAEIAIELNHHFVFQPQIVYKLLSVISFFFLCSLITSPISGIIIDKLKIQLKSAYKQSWSESKIYFSFANCFVVSQLICSFFNILLSIFILIPNQHMVYLTFLCLSVTRSILFSFGSSYILELFPVKYFSKLLGINTLLLGIITPIQFLLLFSDLFRLNIVNYILIGFSLATFSYPLYLRYLNGKHNTHRA